MGGRVIEKKRKREKKNSCSLTRRDEAWAGEVGDRLSKFIARGVSFVLGEFRENSRHSHRSAEAPSNETAVELINLSYRLIVFREERVRRFRRDRRLETRGLRERRGLLILLLSNDGRNVVLEKKKDGRLVEHESRRRAFERGRERRGSKRKKLMGDNGRERV